MRKNRDPLFPFMLGVASSVVLTFIPGLVLSPRQTYSTQSFMVSLLDGGMIFLFLPVVWFSMAMGRLVLRWTRSAKRLWRHLAWVFPLISGSVLVLFTGIWLYQMKALSGPHAIADRWYRGSTAVWMIAGFSGLVFTFIALAGGVAAFNHWRRMTGRLAPWERDAQANSDQMWQFAIASRRQMLAGQGPPTYERHWVVVPYPGEGVVADAMVGYARYYGFDVTYEGGSDIWIGHPVFVLAGIAASAALDGLARSRARAAGRTEWRDWQQCHILVTTQRLVIHVDGNWRSFDYRAMAVIYPDVASATLICQFHDETPPLLISGPAAWVASVMTVAQTYGRTGLADHPGMAAFISPTPVPPVIR